jgi:hypothetical protein
VHFTFSQIAKKRRHSNRHAIASLRKRDNNGGKKLIKIRYGQKENIILHTEIYRYRVSKAALISSGRFCCFCGGFVGCSWYFYLKFLNSRQTFPTNLHPYGTVHEKKHIFSSHLGIFIVVVVTCMWLLFVLNALSLNELKLTN